MKTKKRKSNTNFSDNRNRRSGSKKEKNIIKQIEVLAEPLCESEGLELVHVEYQREPAGRILRLYIDRAAGVALDDCVNVSRQLNNLLDVYLDGRYSGCQKNVSLFKRFFLQPHTRLYRTSAFRNIIMESGNNPTGG